MRNGAENSNIKKNIKSNIEKSKFNFKKFSIYFVSFLCIGTLITTIGLKLLDNFFYNLSNSSIVLNNDFTNNEIKGTKTFKLDNDVELQYSYNNKYYTYLKDGNVEIYNISDNKLFTTIDDENEIVFYNLIYDKNLIVYFTKDDNKIILNTYDVPTKRGTVYNKITVNNFSKIKQIEFSPIINVVLVNIETKAKNKVSNTIYRFNLFNDMNVVSSNKIIDKVVMLKHKETIYYVHSDGNIYLGNTKLNLFKERVEIIGTDIDDKVYFINNAKSKVYIVKNNRIEKTIELMDKDVVKCYTNNESIYIVYPTYLIEISSSEPFKRVTKLSNFVNLEAIKDNTIYLRTKDNYIIINKLNI